MELCLNIGVLGLTGCLSKIIFLISIFFTNSLAFTQEINILSIPLPIQDNSLKFNEKTGIITNLTGKTLKEITDTMIFGNLVDVYFPSKLINCYLFIYKKDDIIIKIAANTEYTMYDNEVLSDKLEKFIAIGYFTINYSDNSSIYMFKGPSYQTPYDILHSINPEQYISINDIESLLNVVFNDVDKGGFISPFFLYTCNLKDGILKVLASPSENKSKSYFMGGWSFIKNK